MSLEHQLAATFGLGTVSAPLVPAAAGWGGHNTVYRLVTSSGPWAVKRHGRLTPAAPPSAFAIERAAHAGGVPMARPVPTAGGGCWTAVDGGLYRCHEWIDGRANENEATDVDEATAMGRIVARLHGLRLACPPAVPAPVAGSKTSSLATWLPP